MYVHIPDCHSPITLLLFPLCVSVAFPLGFSLAQSTIKILLVLLVPAGFFFPSWLLNS